VSAVFPDFYGWNHEQHLAVKEIASVSQSWVYTMFGFYGTETVNVTLLLRTLASYP